MLSPALFMLFSRVGVNPNPLTLTLTITPIHMIYTLCQALCRYGKLHEAFGFPVLVAVRLSEQY